MTFVLVQHGVWPGWSPNADIYLDAGAAAAYLTAARDYRAATGRTDAGIAEPVGGLRTAAEITEMQWAFDHRGTAQSDVLYAKYNMDRGSRARPVMNSPHTLGLCVDIASTFFLNWMITNGAKYGFRRTLVAANDIRHFQYFPGTATAALNVTSLDGGAVAPVRTPPMTDTRLIRDTTTNPPTFWRIDIGPGHKPVNSQYTQTQANDAAQAIGAVTFEADSPARVQAILAVLASLTPTASTGAAAVDLSGVATAAQVTELEAKVSAIKVPTKGTVELA